MKCILFLLFFVSPLFAEEYAKLPERVHVLQLTIYIDANGEVAKICEIIEMNLKDYIKRNHMPTSAEIKQYSNVGYIVEIINKTMI